jgi:hypothetical protein
MTPALAPRLLAVVLGATHPVHAEGSTRASVTWLFGDDDALHAPSAVRPASPAPSVGDRAGYDALATGAASRFTGRENELTVGLSGTARGFLPGVSTRAELALGIDLAGVGARASQLTVEDRGSALGLDFTLGPREGAPRLSLRLFPLNADGLRVGWLELLAWGGQVGPHRESPYDRARTSPRGAALGLDAGPLRAELGVKTATFLEPVPGGPAVEETSYGAHASFELRSGPMTFGAGVGRFEHGRLEGLRSPPRAVTLGASARASIGVGLGSPRAPFGLGLEPSPHAGDVVEDVTDARSGWVVGLEATTLVERLRSFDEPGRSVLAPARAAALFATVRVGALEARALAALREPGFVMRSVPGVYPGLTLPRAAASQSDLLAIASAAVHVLRWLEPGVAFGVRSPAAVMTASLDSLGQPAGATVVVYAPGDVELLPPGEGPVPIVEGSVSLGARWSRLLGATGFVGVRRDFNRTRLGAAMDGAVTRSFADPNRLFYGLAARAVW